MRSATFALLVCASPAFGEAPPSAHAIHDAGRLFLQEQCAVCHAIGIEGDSPNPLSPPFRLIGRKYPVEHLSEALAEGIAVGHGVMPEFELEPEQIDAVISYLQTIQR